MRHIIRKQPCKPVLWSPKQDKARTPMLALKCIWVCDTKWLMVLNEKTLRNSSVASLTIKSRYANISVFINCENS